MVNLSGPLKASRVTHCTVYGIAQPQGNKTSYPFQKTAPDGTPLFYKTKSGKLAPDLGVRVAEGRSPQARKAFEGWREQVSAVAQACHQGAPFDEPLIATYQFFFALPKKTQFPHAPAGRPDLDKLIRAVSDALTGIVFIDDSRIVVYRKTGKFWCDPADERGPRAEIWVQPI